MTGTPVWGIDLSAVCLRAIELVRGDDGKIRAEGWDVVDFAEDVEDVHGATRYAAIGRAVRSFLSRHELDNRRVVVSLRGETAFNRQVTITQRTGEDLSRLLAYEAEQQIPFPAADVYAGTHVHEVRPDGTVHATVLGVLRHHVDDRLKKLDRMQLPVDALQLRPIALNNFCAREGLLGDGTVVIDVDYAGMQVLATSGESFRFRCLPSGGVDLVERMKDKFRLEHRVAVRQATGQAKPKAQHESALALLREEVAHDLAAEAHAVVKQWQAINPGMEVTSIVLFESHAAVPPMAAALKAAFGMPVARPKGFRQIDMDPAVVSAGIQENFAGLARAAGLGLQELDKAAITFKFGPAMMPHTLRGGRIGYLVAAAVVLVMVLAGWQSRRALRTDLEGVVAGLDAVVKRVEGHTQTVLDRRAADDPLPKRLDAWRALAAGRDGRLAWFDALVGALTQPWGRSRADATAPFLVAFETGDVAGQPRAATQARLVLAAAEARPGAEIDNDLDAFVQGLVGQGGLKSATPGGSWVAAHPQKAAPPATDTRPLRFRFHHREWNLVWETTP